MNAQQLATIRAQLETKAGATTSANPGEHGEWKRIALAAEDISGTSSTANDTINGYMLRTAKALESTGTTTGAEENQSYHGFLKRIVDALEGKSSVQQGSLEHRAALGATNAVFAVYSSYAFAYDYKKGEYWSGGTSYAETALPGRTYTRTGAKMEQDVSGVPTPFAANVPAIIPGIGFYSRLAATNLLLNAGQASDLATQSVTLPASAHTLSFIGTGTVTLSGASTAGPLVGTGANNRVSLTFTPTAGSVTFTVTGTVSYAGLVAGTSRSSIIATAGTSVAVAEDRLRTGSTLVDGDMLIWVTALSEVATNPYSADIDDGTGSNNIRFFHRSGGTSQVIVTVGGAIVFNPTVATVPVGTEFTLVALRSGGTWRSGKIVAGVLTWSAAAAAGTFPPGLNRTTVGGAAGVANAMQGFVSFAGSKPGVFDDAAVLAAVAESA